MITFLFFDIVSNTFSALEYNHAFIKLTTYLFYIPAVLHSSLVERRLAYVRAMDLGLYYVDLYFFIFLYFCSRYLQDIRADFYQIFQEDGKRAVIEMLSFWFLNSFAGERGFNKVSFASNPASQNATWRQMGFTYRKKKLSDFGRIISPLPKADK